MPCFLRPRPLPSFQPMAWSIRLPMLSLPNPSRVGCSKSLQGTVYSVSGLPAAPPHPRPGTWPCTHTEAVAIPPYFLRLGSGGSGIPYFSLRSAARSRYFICYKFMRVKMLELAVIFGKHKHGWGKGPCEPVCLAWSLVLRELGRSLTETAITHGCQAIPG